MLFIYFHLQMGKRNIFFENETASHLTNGPKNTSGAIKLDTITLNNLLVKNNSPCQIF